MMATAEAKPPQISPEEYREFLQGLELKQVYLSAAKIKRSRTPDFEAPLRYGHGFGKSKYGQLEDGFSASFTFHAVLLEEDIEQPFGEIDVTFTAEYSSERKMTKKIFEVFEELNLPLNLYPYVREYVHAATSRMGMPSLILPTFKSG
ncbi:hypothetical protein BH24DEI1_BH24DEI1_09510 [soil metagenome]